jgi:NitT/TauT family transport system substrate-binding protein
MMKPASPRPASRRRRAALVSAPLALGLLALAACGSSGSSTGSAAAAASTGCTTTQKVTIMMGTSDMDVSYTPYAILADELGYFAQQCLNVNIIPSGTSATTTQALLSGATDMAMETPDDLILAAQTHALPIKIIYNWIPQIIYTVAVSPNSSITSFADLKGKTVGVVATDSLFNAYLEARLKPYGIPLSDVKQVVTGFGVTPMEALKKGTVDAVLAWPGLWASYQNAGYSFKLLPEASWQSQYYGIGLAATDNYISAHPDIVRKIDRGIAESATYLQTNPVAAIKLFWKQYPQQGPLPGQSQATALKQSEAILNSTLDEMSVGSEPTNYQWGTQNTATWQRQIAYDETTGLLTKTVEPSSFFTNQFTAYANNYNRAAIVAQAKAAGTAG